MFKKLIVGTIATGMLLTGGIGASASTMDLSPVKAIAKSETISLSVGEKVRIPGTYEYGYSEVGDASVFNLIKKGNKWYVEGLEAGRGIIVLEGQVFIIEVTL